MGTEMTRRRRSVVRLGLLALVGAWVVMPSTARAQGAVTVAPVELRAQVPAEFLPVVSGVLRGLDGAATASNVDLRVSATREAREQFVGGQTDMIVSGVPFSAAELADLGKAGRDVIEAPVQAVGLQLFGFVPPIANFPSACIADESCTPDQNEPLGGPYRFTPLTVARIMLSSESIWNSKDFLDNNLPAPGRELFPPPGTARALVRNDPDAFNLYLEQYIALTEPQFRIDQLKRTPQADPAAAPSEAWPQTATPSRLGMDNVVSQVREGLDPASSQFNLGGVLTGAGTFQIRDAFDVDAAKPDVDRVPIYRVQLRNSNNEWLEATPESITAAVAAGRGTPLTGAIGDPVPGAYPISWVNKVYAPSTGLTAEQADLVANIIRYQVTRGRAAAAGFTDGQITDAMVTQALAAANRIVTSNCAAAKGTVYSSDDGAPYAPDGALSGIGSMKLCRGAPLPTTTQPAAATQQAVPDSGFAAGGTSSASSSDLATSDAGLSTLSPTADVSGSELSPSDSASAAGSGTGAAGKAPRAGAVVPTRAVAQRGMPLPIPGRTLSPLDRAVTLALGAVTFVVLRSLYQRRAGLL